MPNNMKRDTCMRLHRRIARDKCCIHTWCASVHFSKSYCFNQFIFRIRMRERGREKKIKTTTRRQQPKPCTSMRSMPDFLCCILSLDENVFIIVISMCICVFCLCTFSRARLHFILSFFPADKKPSVTLVFNRPKPMQHPSTHMELF